MHETHTLFHLPTNFQFFQTYPYKKALTLISQSLHQCNIILKKNKQKRKTNTHCFTLLTHLLILCYPYVVSSGYWDGVTVTKSDFEALKSFKQELTDPHGFLKSWNDSGYGACSGGWVGIKCVQGQVIVIQLPWRGLGGQLTSKVGQLQALRKLSLHDNAIGGSVPKELGFLLNLRGIQLFNNKFTGSIPPTLGSCTLLQSVDFSYNMFDDEIPTEFGNLVMLKSLDLSYNFINGGMPNSFSNLSSLTWLSLAHNNLNGQIPVFLGGLVNLLFFNVSYNNLSGRVPVRLASRFDSSCFVDNLELCGYSPSTACPTSHADRKLSTEDILLVAGGVLMAVLLLFCCVLIFCMLKKDDTDEDEKKDGDESGVGPMKDIPVAVEVEEGGDGEGKLVCFEGGIEFTAEDLVCARVEMLGKNSYGTVYKAALVEGDQVVVTRLREGVIKDENEFETEVNSIGNIRHENLLAMRAYYLGPKGEKLLVFDYMPKGSLASFLHVRGPKEPVKWPTRMRIIKGITKGLLNLHTRHNIIHGNLTSNNILLDVDLNPTIADYGFSWLMATAANSNMIAAAGALGYRAPELSKLKKANTKTDIYSLGVVMLELLTGKSTQEVDDGVGLPQWVASVVNEERTDEVFDLKLMKDSCATGDELLNTLKLALHCVDPSPLARPEVQLIPQQLEDITPETTSEGGGGTSSRGEAGVVLGHFFPY
ncbi:putative protein kinase RLK-Pelle-LRR-III family [Helianthus annuus]|uniref:Protein kinase domain-containing protein n=1 Tax=Helianthus annuus TaxID=4232 RepID=A0A251RSZ3_HELAN|nr:probable leucine-rich repeat receptor-like protein kinase IMK3 [Helianthus annuus]KAF5805637.1 putative protein kinase RLK-Pelle-LRR-III family [Helianthus annuus]KAJ0570037.1 putative protein kinase RLK-Pelle-LRR-III family [Helianthus annuus]KAJ0576743.1 putative protein kinase RLK-Pelle-LRR-III family [Helianthus annuus]KAJ0584367.1 putative protein kinase RLK-Pelle-LRR-III family [Helianthus annuus]KAJ0746996.1 putative protein kinase RLK-Pelle-LRR-III family [Helianthus annuus]